MHELAMHSLTAGMHMHDFQASSTSFPASLLVWLVNFFFSTKLSDTYHIAGCRIISILHLNMSLLRYIIAKYMHALIIMLWMIKTYS